MDSGSDRGAGCCFGESAFSRGRVSGDSLMFTTMANRKLDFRLDEIRRGVVRASTKLSRTSAARHYRGCCRLRFTSDAPLQPARFYTARICSHVRQKIRERISGAVFTNERLIDTRSGSIYRLVKSPRANGPPFETFPFCVSRRKISGALSYSRGARRELFM